MCATCLSVYECYSRVCGCGERGSSGRVSRAEGEPVERRASKVEGRGGNETRKTRRAVSSRRLSGRLRHPRKISLHQFSTVQSGRIRQENSEVRALRMVFLRNALLRLHHGRRRRRTTGSETRKPERRAEPREEERSATERKPAPRPRACRRFHSLLNHQTSEGIRILCVSSSTVGPGEAGRGTGGRDDSFASPSTMTSSRIAHLHRGTASRGGGRNARQSESVRARILVDERRASTRGASECV